MKRFDVAAIGSGNIDLIFSVPRLPKNDDKVIGKKLAEQIGGTVANCACTMSNLGLQVTTVSCVGDDHHAKAILDDFTHYNVHLEHVTHIPGLQANTAIIFIDGSGEKSLVYAPSADTGWDKNKARQAVAQSKIMYSMPADISKFQLLAEHAHLHQTKVAVDIEPHIADRKVDLESILTLADIVIFNQDGFITGCQCEPQIEILRQLRKQYSLDALVVTLGAKGVMAVTEYDAAQHDGFKIPIVDTTGAGDTFNAAFIYTQLNHYSLNDALAFASAAAAINISSLGARGHLATIDEITEFLRSH